MPEAQELEEHVEHAKDPFDKRVAATMAIIAAALAIVSVLGHVMTTEELLNQQRASDQWAYYQAKSIRRYESEVARDLFAAMKLNDKTKEYTDNAAKYRKDDEEIQRQAEELEKDSRRHGRQALGAHFGEVFLEFAIVLASLAILAKRAALWYGAICAGLIGACVAGATYWFPELIQTMSR